MASSVAGIIDRNGGLRVVIAAPETFHSHVGPGERIFIVPDYEIEEPVSYNDTPSVIVHVQRHVRAVLTQEMIERERHTL